MPTGSSDSLARRKFPLSYRELDRFSGGSSRSLLATLAVQDAVVFFDDFLGDTINLDIYTAAETGAATPFAIPATGIVGGAATSVTGTADNNSQSLRGHRIWAGDNNAWMEARVRLSLAAQFNLEVGLIDAASDLTIPTVSDVDTPAFAGGTADAAVIHIDTDQTSQNLTFVTEGSTANMNATAQTFSPVVTINPTAFDTYRVGLAGDIPFASFNGTRATTTTSGVIGHRVEGGTLLRFYLAVRTRNAAQAITTDLDYVFQMQDRAARTT